MKKIGLMVALNKEMEFFTGFIDFFETKILHKSKFQIGKYAENEIVAVISGMGNVNAALCASDLINIFNVDMIINVGISGGLTPKLNIGDFIVGDEIVYHDVWCGKPNKIGQVQDLPELFYSNKQLTSMLPDLKHGQICCGDLFVDNKSALDNIVANFPKALAVDMESAAIAQTCYLYDKPLLSVRQISDTPGIKHHAEQYASFWENAPKNSADMVKKLLKEIK
ncbi:MAG: 5'-methylthioadenosine/adenosylhomocysteine nucleosidase [Alphaproteobacteria bacterium]|nr:5'-methylthioadenosine/adenosylhomocysteine nucleosidase [Alphaproteobacteria bacterium]